MEFTKKEKQIAQRIVADKDMMKLLKKILEFEEGSLFSVKDMNSVSDEHAGQIVKAERLAQMKKRNAYIQLERAGRTETKKKRPVAPE